VPSSTEQTSDANKGGGGSEALRILEGLKSRPKTYRGYATGVGPSVNAEHPADANNTSVGVSDNMSISSSRFDDSPSLSHSLTPLPPLPLTPHRSTISRAQIQDKIRGTLSSISASLSLEPTPGSPLTRVSSGHSSSCLLLTHNTQRIKYSHMELLIVILLLAFKD
jgi:hypothetical protein